jgi:DNA-binding PadR family transcriptional regulator
VSLEHIILGALDEPRSGYELKRWFDDVFAFFWNADQSQIYRTLNRLSDQGLLSAKAAASSFGPDKRLYRITAKGRAELKRWLKDGPTSPAQRSAIYAQLIFLSELSTGEAAAFLAAFRAQADNLVAALEQVPNEEAAPSGSLGERRVAFFNRASLALGLARARATQSVAAALLRDYETQFATEDDDGHAA